MAGAYVSGTAEFAPAVVTAIEEVRRSFPDSVVDSAADSAGGAYVVIREVELGVLYLQSQSWLGFHVSYVYPAADVYPHYVRPDLARSDGQPLPAGFAAGNWTYGDQSVVQISRRSSRWDPNRDSAALKAVKVLSWLRKPI
jgi:hypothetical protein